MTPDTHHEESSAADNGQQDVAEARLSEEQLRQLADAELQARFRKEALVQLRRRQCPGCGEEELF